MEGWHGHGLNQHRHVQLNSRHVTIYQPKTSLFLIITRPKGTDAILLTTLKALLLTSRVTYFWVQMVNHEPDHWFLPLVRSITVWRHLHWSDMWIIWVRPGVQSDKTLASIETYKLQDENPTWRSGGPDNAAMIILFDSLGTEEKFATLLTSGQLSCWNILKYLFGNVTNAHGRTWSSLR